MRKLIYFLLLSPSILSLGHDVYFFVQKPERGFMVSDLGFLWDKYHKDSHDQWKKQLAALGKDARALTDQFSDATGVDVAKEIEDRKIMPQYAQDTKVEAGTGQDTVVTKSQPSLSQQSEEKEAQSSPMVRAVGFLLKQKAALVFAAFTLIVFCFDMVLRLVFSIFRMRPSGGKAQQMKNQKKDAPYKYGRK